MLSTLTHNIIEPWTIMNLLRRAGIFALLSVGLIVRLPQAGAQAPYGTHFVPTRETPVSVLYDAAHHRFYGTVPAENSVYVMAEADGSVEARITVPSAFALDLSVDGSRLYVSSSEIYLGAGSAQGYFVIDTATLQVIDFAQPAEVGKSLNDPGLPNIVTHTFPRFLAALSDGTVAYVTDQGAAPIYVNQPATNLASPLFADYFYEGGLTKSLDGSTFVATSGSSSNDNLYLYDTSSASITANLTTASTNSADVAISPDGQKVLLGGHILLNRSLAQIGDLSPGAQFAFLSAGSSFSPDGSRIYVLSTTNVAQPSIVIYNTSSAQVAGYLPLPIAAGGNTVEALAVGTTGHVLFPSASGFVEMDASNPLQTLSTNATATISSISPNTGNALAPATATLSGIGFDSSSTVFFGQQQAQTKYTSPTSLAVQPPIPTAAVSPVSVMATYAGGWAQLSPNAYSYGPVVAQQDVTAGTSAGGTTVKLYGYGLAAGGNVQVSVGGRSATVSAIKGSGGLESITFATPSGNIGPADIQVTTSFGTTTIAHGFTYLKEQMIGAILPYQMVVDNQRGKLYAADAKSGNVLSIDASTLAVTTLFASPTNPSTGLAITPDGATLVSASAPTETLDLIDLSSGQHTKSIIAAPANVPDGFYLTNVAATSRGSVLVSVQNPELNVGGTAYEIDLTSGAVAPVLVGAVATSTAKTLFAPSGDGNAVYLTADGAQGYDGGEMDMWLAGSDQSGAVLSTESTYQIATDDAGDILLADSGIFDTRFRQWSKIAPSSVLLAERGLVEGEKLHSSGALAYIPTTLGLEVADVHNGTTLVSIGEPSGSLETADNLAIDHTGTRIYLAETDGIHAIDLAAAPLSIGSITPASGNASAGQNLTLRGSGFVSGTSVTIDGKPSTVNFVDSTTLRLKTPAVTAAKDAVAVTNPDGSVYTLSAAFDAGTPLPAVPVLASVQPSYLSTGRGGIDFIVDGTGFTPTSIVLFNGEQVASTFNNTGQILADFLNLPGPGKQAVTVINPPNLTPSNPAYITTYTVGLSFINSITPMTIAAGSSSFVITAFGNGGFGQGATIYWNGSALPTTPYGYNYLYATVPASLVSSPGTASVTVVVPGNRASDPLPFTITQAVASATLTAAATDLGGAFVGTSASTTIVVASTGSVPLSFTGVSLSDSADFSQTNDCPASLSQGQTCTIQVKFTPTASTSIASPVATIVSLNGNASANSSVALSGSAAALSFLPTSAISVTAGATGSTSLSLLVNGAEVPKGNVTLSCTAGLPANSSCTFSPATQNLAASMSSILTISTSAGTRAEREAGKTTVEIAAVSLFALLIPFRRRRLVRGLVLTLAAVGVIAVVSGCSSGSSGGGGSTPPLSGNTPSGSYTITVTATSSGTTQASVVSLTVN